MTRETKTVIIRLLAAILIVSSCAGASAQSGDETATIAVKVIDQMTGAPIEGAQVRLNSNVLETTVATDGAGACQLVLPTRRVAYIRIYADAPGYVTMRSGYGGRQPVLNNLPENCTFEMSKGTTIGGTVVDEEGKPLAGATLTFDMFGTGTSPSPWIQKLKLTTDDQGRWTFDMAPVTSEYVTLTIAHPFACRHAENVNHDGDADATQVRYADMLVGRAVYTLKRGAEVKGIVRDENGAPIGGAAVTCDEENQFPGVEVATTNDAGEFRFQWLPGRVRVVVRAEGRAPDLKVFDLNGEQAPLEFALKPGAVFHGRVVDPHGQPIEGVTVYAGEWRGVGHVLGWDVKTDTEGRFEWRSAPTDPFTIDCHGQGRMRIWRMPAVVGEDEMVITMHPALRIVGTVKDASTAEPIKSFKFVPGGDWGPQQPVRWFLNEATEGVNGAFEFVFDFPRKGHAIKIEAPGYAPFESQLFVEKDGDQQLDVQLQRAMETTGVALRPDGSPAAGATILVATPGSPVFLDQGKPMEGQSMFSVTADDQGKFSLPPQTGTFWIVGIDDVGYAMMTDVALKESQPLVLQPWCRIEGVLLVDGAPAAGREMDVQMYRDHVIDRTPVQIRGDATTDADGRFVFERVPPGLGQVTESMPIGPMMSTTCRYLAFDGAPGETIRITTGLGATVTGRLVAPKQSSRAVGFAVSRGRFSRPYALPTPEGFDKLPPEEQRAWHKTWNESDDGARLRREYFRSECGRAFLVNADGSFSVDGVKPGTYDLKVEVFDPASADPRFAEPMAMLNREAIEIPDVGASRTPVDLGDLEVEVRLGPGDPAPVFETMTVDGQPLKLADFAGKYVFLDFWAVWCGPCKAEIPNVRAAYEALKDRDDFVIISLSLDNESETPKAYAEANNMPWIQGFLGKWSEDQVTKLYGVQGIPATFLIGPDGRIIARGLRGPELTAAIRKAIGSRSE